MLERAGDTLVQLGLAAVPGPDRKSGHVLSCDSPIRLTVVSLIEIGDRDKWEIGRSKGK